MQEEWRPVVGFEGIYEVSERGFVRRSGVRSQGTRIGRLLTPVHKKDGYLYYFLTKPKGQRIRKSVHRLVAEAFLGVKEGMVVHHKDSNRSNNVLSNLQWVTVQENGIYARLQRRHSAGHRPPGRRKLSEVDIRLIRWLQRRFTYKQLASMFSVSPLTISQIVRGVTWSQVV